MVIAEKHDLEEQNCKSLIVSHDYLNSDCNYLRVVSDVKIDTFRVRVEVKCDYVNVMFVKYKR